MRTREAIDKFLQARTDDSPFLLRRYCTNLETQIMTSREGEAGENGEFMADGEVWKDKRWPYQAGSDPNYNDPPITFSPAARVDRVGTTWWNFETKRSVAVGIDIDYQEGHAATTTTNDEDQLAQIVEKLSGLEYVTIVRSTGGKGLHVYVFFDEDDQPEANNHHEHTQVARKTLELISADIGYNLRDHVDCVGSVFWIWAAKSPKDHPGFTVVKEGTSLAGSKLANIELPAPSVAGRNQTDFEVTELEEEHKRVLEAIAAQPYYFNHRHDMGLIHTHTHAIKCAIDAGLEILGSFNTDSDGSDPNTANCFLAPQPGGAFRVFRFGQSQHESTWEFVNGKNFCYLNDEESTQEVVSRHAKGCKGGLYQFTPEGVEGLAEAMGESLPAGFSIPDDVKVDKPEPGATEITLVSKKGGDGWTQKGKVFVHTIKTNRKSDFRSRILRRADEHIRYVIQDGNPRGWYHKTEKDVWLLHRNYNECAVVARGMFKEFEPMVHQMMLENPWTMVKIPFEDEYPKGRRWNLGAPRLKVKATDPGNHPHYDMILQHVGQELDEPVQSCDWCRRANLHSGADYLRAWLASLIHYTDQPLPYLFLSGPQNSGKSIFHECTRFLFTHGITSANSALTSAFNGELAGCFLVYVEERDLTDKRYNAYEKIKEWVTGRDLLIQEKYQTPYLTPNYLHFVQMANNAKHLPMEDGDTRIVALDVPALENPMPKAQMEKKLAEEAPRFLATLMNTQLPPPVSRLRVPALSTPTKRNMEGNAMTPLMAWLRDGVFAKCGHCVKLSDLYAKFKSDQERHNKTVPSEFAVGLEIMNRSDRYEIGQRGAEQYLLNYSFDEKAKPKKKALSTNSSGRF